MFGTSIKRTRKYLPECNTRGVRACMSEWVSHSRPGSLRVRAEAKETVEYRAAYTCITDSVCCL